MNSTHAAILLLSGLSLATTWIGVWLAKRLRENARGIATGIGFSVGIMLLISLVELVPEATAAAGLFPALGTFVLGAGLVWSANVIVPHHHLVEENGLFDSGAIRTAYLVAIGLILHDVPEGFAMANGYVASPSLGIMIAIAIALHNVPEEFAMAVPAVMTGRRKFLYRAAVVSALAEPLGAILGIVAVGMAPGLNAHFMAFAAGAMTFVSLHELYPMSRRYGNTSWFVFGLGVSLLVYAFLAAVSP